MENTMNGLEKGVVALVTLVSMCRNNIISDLSVT